jgi:hypothetical protein
LMRQLLALLRVLCDGRSYARSQRDEHNSPYHFDTAESTGEAPRAA